MNPSEKYCWKACASCFRCANKGTLAACRSCSGRHDPQEKWDPYDFDDMCRCTEGILQWRTQTGLMIQRRYPNNPFRGRVNNEATTEDERDWNAYVETQREKLGDPNWDPVRYADGSSTYDFSKQAKGY